MPNEGDRGVRADSEDPNEETWSFPDTLPDPATDDDTDVAEVPDVSWVPFSTVPASEADQLCSQLESEGFPTHVQEQDSVAEPLPDQRRVTILVQEDHIESAREALANPPDPHELETNEREMEEYFAEYWICPKCRKQTLKLLPLAGARLYARVGAILLLSLPFLVMAFEFAIPLKVISDFWDRVPSWLWFTWVAGVGALLGCSVPPTRDKQCVECGWTTRLGGE